MNITFRLYKPQKRLTALLTLSLIFSLATPKALSAGTASVQATPEEAEYLLSDSQVVTQLHSYSVKSLLPAIFSKIDALKLVIGNNGIKLNTKEREKLLSNLGSPKKAFEDNAELLMGDQKTGSTKEALVASLLFNNQLITYLDTAIKNNFKGMTPFTFTHTKKDYSSREILDLFQEVVLRLEQFETTFNTVGNPVGNALVKKVSSFVNYYDIWSKTKIAGLGLFLACFLRYKLKSPPSAQGTGTGSAANSSEAESLTWNSLGLWKSFGSPLNTLDSKVIGTPPEHEPTLGSDGKWHSQLKQGSGTGIFGWVHENINSVVQLVTFPLALTAMFDQIASGISSWKSLNRSPKTFFKIEELFKNKKQTVSAIDEFFLSSAIEHTAPKLTFDDIAGLEEQKKELQPIINYLLNPELFEKTGTSIEKGYLFYGPTRTGKTYLAEALAGELVLKHKRKLAFIKIRSSELRLVGIKKVLDMVSKYAPCIVFIDELDLLNLQRDHNTTLLEEFLTSMKHDTGNHQVIFLAATNRIDHIDHALLQPGRFGKIIPFENPSIEDRRLFFEHHLARKNIYDPELLDISKLAHETAGCSFGDLASITNNALALATQKREMLSYRHFDISIDSFKNKITDSAINLPESERNIIATHLAGHALAYQLLATGEQLHKVTMLPIQKKISEENIWLSNLKDVKKVTSYGDVFTLRKTDTGGFDIAEQKINRIKALLAGYVAEKILLGSSSYSYHNEDQEQARQIAESLVFKGIKKEHFSREASDKKLDEVMQLLNTCEAEVTTLLQNNKGTLEKLTDALKKHVTLTAEDVTALIK